MNLCQMVFPHLSSESWTAICADEGWASPLASLLALLVVLALFVWLLRAMTAAIRRSRSPNPGRSAFAPLAAILAALLLAMAAGRPAYVHARSESVDHIIVLVDQSESARRQAAERTDRIQMAANHLTALGERHRDRLVVSIVDFAATTRLRLDRGSVEAASNLLLDDRPAEDLSDGGSDLGAALAEAKRLASREPDGDVVTLISDGNDTVVGLDEVAQSSAGSPSVFIWPVDAGAPAEGIVSGYLPAIVESGSEPILRLVFDPGAASENDIWNLKLNRNGTEIALSDDTIETEGGRKDLQIPVAFDGRGLQFVEVAITAGDRSFTQRLFTLVRSPIKVAGVGETGFLSSLPADKFTVTNRSASDLERIADYDVVVLGGQDAGDVPTSLVEGLAQGVSTGGLGLLLVNGPMRGTVEDPTVVQSYADTPLDLLLPVSPDPKFLLEDPPPRDIIVLVDTSGSMFPDGQRAAARAINDILAYMRPIDMIQIVSFGGRKSGKIEGDEQGKTEIRRFVAGLSQGDASDVARAFDIALENAGNYTSVFLITDGEVKDYDFARAGLSFYYLEYGFGGISNPGIASAARATQILTESGLSFTPESFEPEEKTEFFAPGRILPKTVKAFDGIAPDVPTNGVALSYPREDADVALVSDGPDGEPVLAFRRDRSLGGGQTAAFLSAFDGAWTNGQAGRRSLEAIIAKLAEWSDRSRYDIRVSDRGSDVVIRITILSTDRNMALPESIVATLVGETGNAGVTLRPVNGTEGVFEGRIRLPVRSDEAAEPLTGLLVLEETGSGSANTKQSIPFQLPNARRSTGMDMREAASFGVDRLGLERLAGETAGAFDALPGQDRGDEGAAPVPEPAHLPFIGFAALFFALAVLGKAVRL